MKTLRTHLRTLLALLLAFASTPAWACARSCSPAAEASLACVKLCAHSQTLLTQGGKFDSLGAQACGVLGSDTQTVFPVAAFELAQPEAGLASWVESVHVQAPQLTLAAAAGRAPPSAPDFLGSYHPQANAPPSFR